MKRITYSVQGSASHSNVELTLENLKTLLPNLVNKNLLNLGDENCQVTVIDADADAKYKGMTPQEAMVADDGNVHIALETLLNLEKLVSKIIALDMDYTFKSIKMRLDAETKALQAVLIDVCYRTDDLNDESEALESISTLCFDLIDSEFNLNEDSIQSTIVSLYAGIDIWGNEDFVTLSKHSVINDFIRGFEKSKNSMLCSFMVNFIENLFKSSIKNHHTDITEELLKSCIMYSNVA